tara:strand:- start:3436 stop:4596 length:1161 start_codon:yes stop_codon:yes gene_type:complete
MTASRTTPAPRRWTKRLAVLTVSTLVSLFLAEVGCRVAVHFQNRDALEASWNRAQTTEYEERRGGVGLGALIQLSSNDRIAYELRPNLDGIMFKGKPVTTNARGFRSDERPSEPADGEVTILGLGDSIMFGHGLADGEAYLDHLEDFLNERHPEKRWRTVNTSVPGYNTVMQVETLARKGLAFRPNLVVLGVCGNDYEPPNFVREGHDPLDVSRSFFWTFLSSGLETVEQGESSGGGLVFRQRWGAEQAEGAALEAPTRYSGLYGKEAFEQACQQLLDMAEEHQFSLLSFAHLTYDEPPCEHNAAGEMLEWLQAHDVPALDLQYQIDEVLLETTGRAFNLKDYGQSDLVVSPSNTHPSAKQHLRIAETLYQQMLDSGEIQRLIDLP